VRLILASPNRFVQRCGGLNRRRLVYIFAYPARYWTDFDNKRLYIWRAETIISNFYGFSPTPLNRAITTWIIAAVDGVIFQMLISTKIVAKEDLMKVWEVFLKEGLPHILKIISEMNPDKE
jgi:hypothetical protein